MQLPAISYLWEKKCVKIKCNGGNKKRKEKKRKEKLIAHMIRQKKARNFPVLSQCLLAKLNESWQSWFKVLTARHGVNEGAQ